MTKESTRAAEAKANPESESGCGSGAEVHFRARIPEMTVGKSGSARYRAGSCNARPAEIHAGDGWMKLGEKHGDFRPLRAGVFLCPISPSAIVCFYFYKGEHHESE